MYEVIRRGNRHNISSRICGGAVRWYYRKWCQSHDRKWRQSRVLSGGMAYACATVSCAISALVGPFDRKWQSHVTGRGHVRKYDMCMPGFSPRFVLTSSTVVTWLPDVTEGHLIPSVFPWVCATPRSDRRSRDPFGSVILSTTSACPEVCSAHAQPGVTSSNNKTLDARLLARVITGCHYT
jgi:hypothetical protein